MKEYSYKKADIFLETDNRELKSVFAKIKDIAELNKQVIPYLEPNVANYCQVANQEGKRLILVVANGSVATQLRFQTLDLLRKFKQNPKLQHIQEIQCKVRPPQPTSNRT